MERYRQSGIGGSSCASAMAFYRLRRSLALVAPGINLRPSTSLRGLTRMSAGRLFKTISVETGLRLPRKAISWIGKLAVVGFICSILGFLPAGIVGGTEGTSFVAAVFAVSIALLSFDPGRIPKDCETLGKLSSKVARLNIGQLTALGARAGEKELWQALTEVISPYSLIPVLEMKSEALLLQSQLKAA